MGSWKTNKSVALSSTEAEFIAPSEASKETMYLTIQLKELKIETGKITIYNDNQGAQELIKNQILVRTEVHAHRTHAGRRPNEGTVWTETSAMHGKFRNYRNKHIFEGAC